ncbi:protein HEADING DATE 3B-like isoform X1 [Punica granatum]|uniref:Protein HEADING DATE 3B-like isoform X1 n=1 Tax=Punica granatum TaxID=22663 RepID=A0A6P8CKD9_PUNGR|nr:protein HEADING DATE 3B-like isoform X1 [Punica granatum]
MMRGGRDDERRQVMKESPVMFPRLHVNDREKGGLRAPPRNKMALYEQFSIPLPPQRSICGESASSTSNGGGGLHNYTYMPSYNFPATSGSAQKPRPSSLAGVEINDIVETNEQNRTLDMIIAPSLATKACLYQPQDSHFSKPSWRKPGGSEEITSLRFSNPNVSSHKAHRTVPRLELRRLELIDVESGQLRGVPLSQYPVSRKSPHVNLRPPIKNAENSQVSKRPHESLSRGQKDSSVRQDSTFGGDCVLLTMTQNEGINGNPSELEHEGVSASSRLLPDDVEKIIGQKKFWKARRAIVYQQRLFAVQLFELHRLLKVQNLLSRSPDILLGESLYFRNSTVEVSPSGFLPKLKLNSDTGKEDATGKPPDNAGGIDMPNIPVAVQPNPMPSSEKVLEHENTSKPGMWCFPPTGNQWLVPIVSPSEGLVYKPYTGPGPPGTGIRGPVCGLIQPGLGCGREYLNAALGAQPPVGPSYFPPYGMAMTKSVPNQTPDQVSSFGWLNSKGPSEQVSRVVSLNLGKSRGREVEGSTASSPSEKLNEELSLSLLHTTPLKEKDNSRGSGKQQTKAIKVVPYNPKRASESATRIFQLIQEERRHSTNE